MSASSPTLSDAPAGLGWRLGARIVDAVLFTWLVVFVIVEIDQRLLGGDPLGRRPARLEFDDGRSIVLLLAAVVIYEVVPLLAFEATPGKAVMGMRIRRVGAGLPAGLAALGRATIVYVPPMFFGAYGGIVPLVLLASVVTMADGRGLHDRLLGTLVVMIDRGER